MSFECVITFWTITICMNIFLNSLSGLSAIKKYIYNEWAMIINWKLKD